jgi:hypothetical protein
MMRKKRGYKREVELVRDYKLFAIACEGGKREPDYFKIFRFVSNRIAVDVIEDVVSEEGILNINPHKSAPKWVLERAIRYIEKEGLSDEDDLWFVMDIDRWSDEQLREVASYCEKFKNWHIVLSNPCFEVWLYFHKKSNIKISLSNSCNDFKNEISTFEKGGYNPLKFIPYFVDAIKNAKAADNDKNHFLPNTKVSKVYQLGEEIIKVISQKGFDNFIAETLPQLIKQEIERTKKSRRGKKF